MTSKKKATYQDRKGSLGFLLFHFQGWESLFGTEWCFSESVTPNLKLTLPLQCRGLARAGKRWHMCSNMGSRQRDHKWGWCFQWGLNVATKGHHERPTLRSSLCFFLATKASHNHKNNVKVSIYIGWLGIGRSMTWWIGPLMLHLILVEV